MKKSNVHKFLFSVSAFLLLGFAVRFGVDVFKYDSYNGSAPLYVYALARAVEFILPSMITFVVAVACKKKFVVRKSHREDESDNT